MNDRMSNDELNGSVGASVDDNNGPKRKTRNPIYFLLFIVGFLFCLTAWLTCLVTIRDLDHSASSPEPSALMRFVGEYGTTLLVVELALLALFAVIAIVTDSLRERRASENRRGPCEQEDCTDDR